MFKPTPSPPAVAAVATTEETPHDGEAGMTAASPSSVDGPTVDATVEQPHHEENTDADDGRAQYERCLALQRDITALSAELLIASEAYESALGDPIELGDSAASRAANLDARVTRLTDLEQRVATLQRELSAKQHRYMLEDELLFPYRQRARGRVEEEKRERIATIEREGAALKAEIADHLRAVEDLEHRRSTLERRIAPIQQDIERSSLSPSRGLTVNVRLSKAWRPPSEVLMRASSWRRFLERARVEEIESATIIVNELTGLIVRAPFDL